MGLSSLALGTVRSGLLVASYCSLSLVAVAAEPVHRYGGENRGKPVMPTQVNTKWQQECGSCHVAYAPGLLSAASWQKVMDGLDKHFGADASIDAALSKEISTYLTRHASNRWTATTVPLRITATGWFRAKHSAREIDPAVWNRLTVKSAANCSACHKGADRGDFNERDIRIPQ